MRGRIFSVLVVFLVLAMAGCAGSKNVTLTAEAATKVVEEAAETVETEAPSDKSEAINSTAGNSGLPTTASEALARLSDSDRVVFAADGLTVALFFPDWVVPGAKVEVHASWPAKHGYPEGPFVKVPVGPDGKTVLKLEKPAWATQNYPNIWLRLSDGRYVGSGPDENGVYSPCYSRLSQRGQWVIRALDGFPVSAEDAAKRP